MASVTKLAQGRIWFWLRLTLLAGLVRGGWLAANYRALRADPDAYRQLARSVLAEGTLGHRLPHGAGDTDGGDTDGGDTDGDASERDVTARRDTTRTDAAQPSAYRPPLYPLVLAAIGGVDDVGVSSVAGLHWVIGVATVLLVFRLSEDWGLGRWGWLAAGLVACDPILLNQSSLVMTETLATALTVVGLRALTRVSARAAARRACPDEARASRTSPRVGELVADAACAGVAIGLAGLCRPTFLVWGGAVGLAMIFMFLRGFWRVDRETSPNMAWHRAGETAWQVGSLALAAALVLAPWGVRNWVVFGRVIVTTTHGGYTLWLGNNPDFYEFLQRSDRDHVWDSRNLDARYAQIRAQTGYDELAADRWAYDQARSAIRDEPRSFVRACVWRIGSLWGTTPQRIAPDESAARRMARWAVGVWYVGVFAAALIGVWSLGWRLVQPPWLWGLLLCLCFTAMHTVYWSNLRMRGPLMPVICLAAAAGVRRAWPGGPAGAVE